MKTPVTPVLREEARRFALRFACCECAHYDAVTDRCGQGWPTRVTRDAIEKAAEVVFCKEFELA